MQHVILIVSPDPGFIHQIRSHLEEGGRFQVTGASNAQEALSLANSDFFEVAVLDGSIDDIPLVAFSHDLSALQNDIKILVYPPDNNPQSPFLDGMIAHGFLNKPFSGGEIGKAISNLFSSSQNGVDPRVKQIDDLMKQWLQNPETGKKKAEQIQRMTSSEEVMIIIQKQTTASSGLILEELESKIFDFLNRYWKEYENSELARFLRINQEETEKFIYATKLISNVILVLIYPQNTALKQIRRELFQVKEDFQKNYPTLAELRQEIANQALAEIKQRNKQLETMQPADGMISQSELDALAALDNPPKTTPSSPGLTEDELANLTKMLEEMPAPDPQPQTEHQEPAATQTVESDMPGWLKELDAQLITKLDDDKTDFQETVRLNKPLFPEDEEPVNPVSETNDNPDWLKELDAQLVTKLDVEKTDFQETVRVNMPDIPEAVEPVNSVIEKTETPDWLKELDAQLVTKLDDEKTDFQETVRMNVPDTPEEHEPINQIQEEQPVAAEEPVLPSIEPLETLPVEPVLETTMASNLHEKVDQAEPVATENATESLPEIDLKMPWETEENTPEPADATSSQATVETQEISHAATETQPIEGELPAADNTPANEPSPAATSFGAVLADAVATQAESQESQTPTLDNFRFSYTCVLIPAGKDQFLTRDLSEKLSAAISQFHQTQGWKLSSITIRPQYLLWTLIVPINICPKTIIQDVQDQTTSELKNTFPELSQKLESSDFWATDYLAVSGSEPPPVNLIYNFVAETWKKKETNSH